MIRISRPGNVPSRLKRLGEKQTLLDCGAYDACPDDYHSGEVRFPKRDYYRDPKVKDLLVEMHCSKCCYCEKRHRTRAYLHIEHFRPKAGFRQARRQEKDELPGYYWLAYCWRNLLLSCHDCNSVHKRTFFPLSNPKRRARTHHDDITREHLVFINPAEEDPRDHIRFDDDLPKGTSRRGLVTVVRLCLRRVELREDRLALLRQIETYQDILKLPAEDPAVAKLQASAREFIEAAKQRDAEFSSMVIDYVAGFEL